MGSKLKYFRPENLVDEVLEAQKGYVNQQK